MGVGAIYRDRSSISSRAEIRSWISSPRYLDRYSGSVRIRSIKNRLGTYPRKGIVEILGHLEWK